jgi:hypothetical protein
MKAIYGFVADPSLSISHNAYIHLASMHIEHYHYHPTNSAFHDLTTYIKPIPYLRSLLSLGLKFIPTLHHSSNFKNMDATNRVH